MGEKESLRTGLPVVTKETIDSTTKSAKSGADKWGDRLERTKRMMIEQQPHLVKFLGSQVGKYPEELHNALFEIAVATYTLLEQQANSNKLGSTFSVGSEDKG
jgi:hypothetical protein